MSRKIIKQPNGKYACWSPIINDFVYQDLTKEAYIEMRAQEAYQEKKELMKAIFEEIEHGDGEVYLKDYEECLEQIEDNK